MLQNVFQEFLDYFTPERIQNIVAAAVVIAVGLLAMRLLTSFARRLSRRSLTPQYAMLVRKGIKYTIGVIILFIVLHLLGVKITALLGAAGIVGIAIGFASQTSISNLISGLFLISEKPFEIGDVIRVGATMGVIQSIDLLSVKIRTFDNQYIRIPNEKLLNSELTNITRFPVRRLDIHLGVAYKTDVDQLRRVLLDIAAANPYCLDEPEPIVVFTEFGDSALQFLFGVWFHRDDFLNLRNSVMQQIKERFEAEGIEIPFPHLSLYAGSATAPMPVELRESRKEAGGGVSEGTRSRSGSTEGAARSTRTRPPGSRGRRAP
jgi:small-conductance mechanosensitive channel